ncbi:MAG TPA: serine/threonine-protein kinase [Polyangiaceae bacterium]|nr:serine/threonine-protein kinase [Polyangiaceae bacterium]
MLTNPATDVFIGAAIESETESGVRFVLERRLGLGGTAAAYLAWRVSPHGESPAVLKIILPEIVQGHGPKAVTVVRKESVALGRLNEQVPPTPFVVRLMDGGTVIHQHRGAALELPWLAIEYVDGGIEGTTLEDRVRHSIKLTGRAFERERAARVVGHVASGLTDVHAVGVIHRDLTPNNVLCCGFGDSELFKISDFGVAKPAGMADTFGPAVMGTPGYICPEQIQSNTNGPAGDIFSLGCLVFYVLTGEHLFEASNAIEMVQRTSEPRRRSIAEAAALVDELRLDPDACAAIDAVIARATSVDPAHRPQTPRELAAGLVPVLLERATRAPRKERATLMSVGQDSVLPQLSWIVRHPPGDGRIVRSVGWDGDGHCLAATTNGLEYWNGSQWQPAPTRDLPPGLGLRFVRRVAPGRWLVGGDEALVAEYSHAGVSRVIRGKDPAVSFVDASGSAGEVVVMVGLRDESTPELWAAVSGRWLKPLPLNEVAYVAGLSQIDEEHWLVVGRSRHGTGFAALYSPLSWELNKLNAPATRAWVACTSRSEREAALAVGAEGAVLRLERGSVSGDVIPERPNLASVSIDVLAREWAGASGELWCATGGVWQRVFAEEQWGRPFISVFADVASVVAMSVDGGVLECRTVMPSRSSLRPPPR